MRKNSIYEGGWWLVLLATTLNTAFGDTNVGLYNTTVEQFITSNTLKWATLPKEPVMENYVAGAESADGPVYVCRLIHGGDWLLGQLRPNTKTCLVRGGNKYNNFEVLENKENASLVIWQPWVKFLNKIEGSIIVDFSANYIFIGRKKAESGSLSHNIGAIMYETSIGFLLTFDDKPSELDLEDGEILIEVEPISYKLNNVQLSAPHIQQAAPVVYEERVLRNDGEIAATDTAEISYTYEYSLSWGHGNGIGIGLNTSIEMADGTILPSIEWSIQFTETRKAFYTLEQKLEPGTACNVTFRGNLTNRDVQYNATLITNYKEHKSRARPFRGEKVEKTLEVEAIYGEVYFISNNTLVPTTTTTTSTTTTTTTTTTPPPLPPAIEDNDVASAMKNPETPVVIDSNDMMGDSSEGSVKSTGSKEDKISQASVGSLGGNKPSKAHTSIFYVTMLAVPVISLLL